ncbi:MAG TPA: BTAD domain-containing putative transcriptional regulator [Actinomycetota bacterium]|nr:BTAD domain-containing putative transcriptional regulator [Actinomycetota bacterium]
MQFRILGPLEVADGDGPRPLGGPKQRTVLAHLILRANQAMDPDRLIGEVWGDEPPPAARSTLRGYLSHLRKALGPDRIEHRSGGYILRAEPSAIDAVRFETLVDEGRVIRSADPAAAVQIFERALGLWRGSALADLTDQASLQPEIARLEELRLAALEDRIDAELELARHRELVPELETLAAAHPFRERLWLHLMTALYRSDRQADALVAFQRSRDLLAEELGIDPSPELRRLHQRILRQDPSLDIAGEPLRGYRLLEQVGAGSFGSVHRAFQPQVGREVAIKTIHPRFANDPEFIRRFEAEAQLVARLEHPHVVPLYDFWREPDGAYLVMRYLRGGSLRERLAHGPLGVEEAARLLDQMAQALVAAHRQGVVHRDVKPANILFDEEDNAYLSDFGIAKDVEVAEVAPGGTPSPLAYYLSPEELRGEPVTPRTDIYSLGLVLYEILAGRHPFADAPPEEVVAKHLTEPVPSIRAFRPDLPRAVDEVIAVATAKASADRSPDARAMASAFRAALVPAVVRTPATPSTEIRNPYKGLRPFLEPDAADFFGREALVSELVARLVEQGDGSRFLGVVGPSASGKSSLVRAGLLPALRAGAVEGSDRWFLLEMHPGTYPLEELASALMRIAVHPPSDLVERLAQDDLGLVSVAEEMLPPGSDLLLVIDQFEELFTLVDAEDVRARFLGIVVAAATEPTSRVRIVCTLRADFYDRPLAYAGPAGLMKSRTVTVTPLVPEELQRAVVGPAEGVGLRIDPALVAEIVADVATQPGALPLLQYALTELFDQRDDSTLTLDGYRRIGKVSGALSRRAEALYRRLNRSGQEATRQLFLRLITVGREGGDDTRRRVLRSELLSLEVDQGALDAVIDTFGARRLLSFDRDPASRGPTVEVAHEALLTEWGRLRGWIEAAREDVRTHRRLAAGARDWTVSGRDPSFVLRGTHLARFEAWAASSALALTADERDYLEASLAQWNADRVEEEGRKAREAALERRSARRLRGLVAVFAAAALIAATLTFVATDQSSRAEREARIATARELAAAAVANLEVDPELSVLLASEAVDATRSSDGTVLPEAEEALHRAVVASRLELKVPGVGGALAWSPTGVFVTEGPEDSGMIDIRDADTGESVLSFKGHDPDVNHVAFSPDGSRLVSTGDDGKLKVWDPSTGRLLSSVSGDDGSWGVSFSADGSLVAGIWGGTTVRVLDLSTDRVVSTLRVPGAFGTAVSPDGRRLAVVGDGVGSVLDVETGEEQFRLTGVGGLGLAVSWSPDGRYIAATGEDAAGVWDAETGRLRHTLLGHTGSVLSVAWSPDSSRLVTGGSDGTARVWEIGAGVRELWSLSAQETRSGIYGVAFSPDGTMVMAGDLGISAVQIWDLGPNGDAEWLNLPGATQVEFMPDGRRVVTTSGGSALTIWDLQTRRDVRTTGPTKDGFRVENIDVSADGGSIGVGGWVEGDGGSYGGEVARMWDMRTGRELFTVRHSFDVTEVDVSPDGEHLLTLSWDGRVRIVDRVGRVVRVLREDGEILGARFSADGLLIATVAVSDRDPETARVTIWDWARGELARTMKVGRTINDFYGLAFDPSGSRIAMSGSGRSEIRDVESGARVAVLQGPSGGATDIAFSPDGSRVAVANADGTVRLFEADTGAPQLVLPASGCHVSAVAFSPDGSKLASASPCDGVRIWALDIDDLLEIARREVTRPLTDEECRQYLHVDRCPRA